jgi:hypothetical protein
MTDRDDDGPVMFVLGECFGCKRLFTFNAHRVPSIWINGSREPVCEACVARVNPRRIANGLAPIVPLPGAYDPEPTR